MTTHAIVSRPEWLRARIELLAREKALTRQREELSRQRRELPWVRIEKTYWFDAPEGKRSLAELFDGRSQLMIKHFMLAPGQFDGCVGCSFESDHIGPALVHLNHHDVTYVTVARAPLGEIQAFQRRMGWTFPWVSSFGSDFNFDFNVSFTPEQLAAGNAFYNFEYGTFPIEDLSGHSVFYKDADGQVYHTYSAFGRGAEEFLGAYMVLDMMPKGRNETGPNHNMTDWVRHHDRYDHGGHVNGLGRYVPPGAESATAAKPGTCCSQGKA